MRKILCAILLALATTFVVAPAAQAVPPDATTPCGVTPTAGVYTHFVVIWGENRSLTEMDTAAEAPYAEAIANKCTEFTAYQGLARPSQPNYIALTSGSTLKQNGTPFNNCELTGPTADPTCWTSRPSLFGQTTDATYAEAMGSVNCRTEDFGTAPHSYVMKHNPHVVYRTSAAGGGENAECLTNNRQMGTAASGLLNTRINAGTLPQFTFLIPDQCNNSHDCAVVDYDNFLATWVPKILNGPNYAAGNTVVILGMDEPNTAAALTTPMYGVCIAPSSLVNKKAGTVFNHYSILNSIELELGKPRLGAAATANNIRVACNI